MENADYPALERRLGRERLADRLLRQARKEAHLLHQGEGVFRLERLIPFDAAVEWGLRMCGLRGRFYRNFLGVRVVEVVWQFPDLPSAFDGFRLLQLTDLHLDLDRELAPVVEALVRKTPHDAAVVTGDFRNRTDGDYEPCLRGMAIITRSLAPARWGVLGNHDFIEMVPTLEADGLPILLNEVASIERDGDRIWIAGIDDPHFYKTHDIVGVRKAIPDSAFSVLLSHSPETYPEAADARFSFQLSGHTHGGQICLPGGIPVVVPCRLPRRFLAGRWTHKSLQGYTSRGTGSCGVAARWNCPPEITVHTFNRHVFSDG